MDGCSSYHSSVRCVVSISNTKGKAIVKVFKLKPMFNDGIQLYSNAVIERL